ncbi:MAG: PspC domain-containing protein [Bacteroidaceae bacterium]|nr:PspC domain-containing protein [Bacteroidaceae bacterium]MBQ9190983.1 PspC domain-containing protein [Bacteroidaceae bacterium]MBR1665849.1 PspC domain-containing protein [Bacteroidaceae bacterium]
MMTQGRLTRSRYNKWIAGICGGIAEYFGWNPELLRLVWVVLTVSTMFCGGIIYLILWLIMPQE